MKTSVHIKPCKTASSELHNSRRKELDYVRSELSANNESWIGDANLAAYRDRLAALVKAKTGRAMQAKAQPLQEAVVVIKDTTTMADLRRLAAEFEKAFGVTPLQIHAHRDEGHWSAEGEWSPNYHAHIVFDWINHSTGKSIKTSKSDASRMQDLAAKCLGMERGVSSDKRHMDAQRYKAHALSEEVKGLERQRIEKRDAIDKENGQRIKSAAADMFDNLVGRGKLAAAQRRIKELENAAEGEPGRIKSAVDNAVADYAKRVKSLENSLKTAQDNVETYKADAMKLWRFQAVYEYAREHFRRALDYVNELVNGFRVYINGKIEITESNGDPYLRCDLGEESVGMTWSDHAGILLDNESAEAFIAKRSGYQPSTSEGWKR